MEATVNSGTVAPKDSSLVSEKSRVDGTQPRICGFCGKEFLSRFTRQKYCGSRKVRGSCAHLAQVETSKIARHKKFGIPWSPRVCLRCGNKFNPTSRGQKYCGRQKVKGTCSYLRNMELMTIWRRNPDKVEKHKQYMRERWKEFRKTDGYKEYLEQRKAEYCKLRFLVFQRDSFTCQYCGRKAPDVVLQVDHKYPKKKGGKRTLENLITACRHCNIGKSDILLDSPKHSHYRI